MNIILELKDLNVGFNFENGFAKALHGVNFTLDKGKILGVVGESGCGKSLTASSIMGLLPSNAKVESGKVFYKGENLFDYTEKMMQDVRGNKIALIPQDPLTSLNPLYTIGNQLVEVICEHQNVSKKEAEEIAIGALKQVKIPEPEKRFNDYPHQFSGGMRQRVIIAMALTCNPELIIADEPTTALDVTVQAQILNLIKDIQKEREMSMLLITHDLGVVAEVCDYVAVMYAGRIVEYADVKSIFKNPHHPYTKGLIEALPHESKEQLNSIKGQPPSLTEKIEGCVFHPRCSEKTDECVLHKPEYKNLNDVHCSKCHML